MPKPTLTGIQISPEKTNFCPGEDIEFTSVADGNDLKYQWYLNDQPIFEAVEPTLSLKEITKDHEGKYKLVVNDKCPPALTSAVIEVKILPITEITLQPEDVEVKGDEPFELKVDGTGSNIKFQWFKNDSRLIGETNKTFKIVSAVITDEGDYTCQITGDCGDVMSEPATVKVDTSTSSVAFGKEYSDVGFKMSAIYDDRGEQIRVKLISEYDCYSSIKLYDILGNAVAIIYDGSIRQGSNDFVLSASTRQSGVYWLVAECGARRAVRKLMITK